jgi:hypothetical protein
LTRTLPISVGFGLRPRAQQSTSSGDPPTLPFDTHPTTFLLVALATAAGSAVNSIAGGGTLLTFPALVALGVPGLVANATSTVALVPGSVGAFLGYRGELAGARSWAVRYGVPSVLGGAVGAALLLATPAQRFDALVPWLVIGATLLFVIQRPLMLLLRGRPAPEGHDPATRPPSWPALGFQFVVGVYGGYFGAGIGILMLAALGVMGFTNIHRMNGLKSFGGTCANLTAAVTFAASNLVNWQLAAVMMAAAVAGGYGGSRLAQQVSQAWVRRAIIAIGFGSGLWMLTRSLP